MKKNIAIIAGGDSSEVVVSLRSAKGIYSFMDKEKYNLYIITLIGNEWFYENEEGFKYNIDKNDFSITLPEGKIIFDFAYITIHGTPGENGILQGYFELLRLPYSCCGVLAASLTFNKYICNQYLKGFGIPVANSIRLKKGDVVADSYVVENIGLPCFIKPNVGGSSFGTTKVKLVSEIQPAIKDAFDEGPEVIIEAFMKGTEVTCGCYKSKDKLIIFPITEVVSKNDFFDYEAKYNADKVEEITPARISEDKAEKIRELTSLIYNVADCKGIIRADFIIIGDQPYLLEVNTTPGMTATSFIPQQIKAAGLDIKDVMTDIIENELNI